MPTTYMHLTCQFESQSGLPEDRWINTFNVKSDTLSAGAIVAQFGSQIEDFWNEAASGITPSHALSQAVDRTVDALVLGYNVTAHLDGSTAGPPVDAGYSFTLEANVGATPFPNEVAACLSFHGAGSFPEGPPEGPRPAERHRGRIYLGPLDYAATVNDTDVATLGDVTVDSGFRVGVVANAATYLKSTAGGATWCVWSRANQEFYPVAGGFMDNTFDTQRRRGAAPTTRTTF